MEPIERSREMEIERAIYVTYLFSVVINLLDILYSKITILCSKIQDGVLPESVLKPAFYYYSPCSEIFGDAWCPRYMSGKTN